MKGRAAACSGGGCHTHVAALRNCPLCLRQSLARSSSQTSLSCCQPAQTAFWPAPQQVPSLCGTMPGQPRAPCTVGPPTTVRQCTYRGTTFGHVRVMQMMSESEILLTWCAGRSSWWHGSTARIACAMCICCRRRPCWRPRLAAAWCGPRWQPRVRRWPTRLSAAPGAWRTFCWSTMRSAWALSSPSRHGGSAD